ncbi:cysteine hydrolase family protein [archaeon]|nr:cysteine hydrolase family protein [archaeon]
MVKIIFYDVDTQNDFINEDGKLSVPQAKEIRSNLEKLTNHAVEKGIPLFGSVDAHFGTPDYRHREGELSRHSGPFPDHCMVDTSGQLKIPETTHKYLTQLFLEHSLDWNANALSERELEDKLTDFLSGVRPNSGRGVFFEKQSYDVRSNPYFNMTLDVLNPEVAIVYGVATDYCVKAAVEGLLAKNVQVYLVVDAIKGIDSAVSESLLAKWEKEDGVKLVTTEEALEKFGGAN